MHRDIRKPLVLFTPKLLLRLPAARSRTEEFTSSHFRELLPDVKDLGANDVGAALMCAGKAYYELAERREKEGRDDVAILRLEQMYPFPREQLFEALGTYPKLRALRWVQEEPENMGAYYYLHTVLHSGLPGNVAFSHVSREESASPAPGSATLHEQEQEELLTAAFEGL